MDVPRSIWGALATTVVLGAFAMGAAAQSASGRDLTRMFNGEPGGSQASFSTRPAKVFLDSADGGELSLRWSAWTNQRAIATGLSRPDHGVYHVRVTMTRPRGGLFTRMVKSTEYGHVWHTYTLVLAESRDSSDFTWTIASWVRNPDSGLRFWP